MAGGRCHPFPTQEAPVLYPPSEWTLCGYSTRVPKAGRAGRGYRDQRQSRPCLSSGSSGQSGVATMSAALCNRDNSLKEER